MGVFAVDGTSEISLLLELVDDGIIDKLLIECRNEVYGKLDDEMKRQTASDRVESSKNKLWRSKEVFELPEICGDPGNRKMAWQREGWTGDGSELAIFNCQYFRE